MSTSRKFGIATVLFLSGTVATRAYVTTAGGARWPSGAVVMQLQLGTSGGVLIDGSANWSVSAEAALAAWNPYFSGRDFRVVRDSAVPAGNGDRINHVFWSDGVYGRTFESNTLAVTVSWWSGSTRVEADVIFNDKMSWNSYRGGSRSGASGGALYDFRRVAIHEFGHALGLGHPDEAGQNVTSIMNSRYSNQELLAADDIDGAVALYGGGAPPPPPPGTPAAINFPPRNESLEFRTALEARYRDVMRRASTGSFVDNEGSVVWTQEYLRYRVNQCGHQDATNRVMLQIDGRGIQPVCGTATSASFPPRNEPFDFRSQLEAKYRDGLRRGSSQTYVDVEGDIVWTQEYLRYRVSRCTHAQAQDRVFQQIAGLGIQPGC